LHSLAGAAGGYVLGNLLGGVLGLTGLGALVAFGWATHLLADACTAHGVPLLWPLGCGRVKLPPGIATGSGMEAVGLAPALGGLLVYAAGGRLLPAAGLT